MNHATGYGALTPALLLDALDHLGLRPDGRLLQLNSYENRVHQAFLEDGSAVVTKFYRPGRWSDEQILEEHAFACELAEAELPVVAPLVLEAPAGAQVQLHGQPPTLASWQVAGERLRWSVSPRRAGREPALEDQETLLRLGRFIGRLHAIGRQRPFLHRRRMDPYNDGPAAVRLLFDRGAVTESERGAWLDTAEQALHLVGRAFHAHDPWTPVRLHGDMHPGNLLWRDGTPNMVDLDDACSGPAVQDLWMLLGPDPRRETAALEHLLEGYAQWCDFDRRELALIEPLRTLRMLRHSAWIAERWSDGAFPAAFPFFGSPAYWAQQTAQLREQIVAMQEFA